MNLERIMVVDHTTAGCDNTDLDSQYLVEMTCSTFKITEVSPLDDDHRMTDQGQQVRSCEAKWINSS